MAKNEEVKSGIIFPRGDKNDAFAQYFVGQSYLQGLVNDEQVNVGVGNVTFEADRDEYFRVKNLYYVAGAM